MNTWVEILPFSRLKAASVVVPFMRGVLCPNGSSRTVFISNDHVR
ncbi:hypothetical protein TSMEX_006161 [Taenia solium]